MEYVYKAMQHHCDWCSEHKRRQDKRRCSGFLVAPADLRLEGASTGAQTRVRESPGRPPANPALERGAMATGAMIAETQRAGAAMPVRLICCEVLSAT